MSKITQGSHVAMTQCVRCKRSVTKKKTLASRVELGSIFSKKKEFSMKTGQREKRAPAYAVVSVTRECRDRKACNEYLNPKKEEAPGGQE